MAENICCLPREVQQWDFTVLEINLYLDTHPNDAKAMAEFASACEKLAAAKERYAAAGCPLTPCTSVSGGRWSWSATPWPWEE